MWQKFRHTLEWIKFSHTLFALPFGLAAYFVATDGQLRLHTLIWVLLCLVSARSAAMGFNRLVDAKYDALNPRTRNRHLPAGTLSKSYAIVFIAICSAIFIFSAFQLNRLCGILSPFCLGILFFYSVTKRFTHATQLFLGLSLGMAPVGATIAVLGHPTLDSIVLGFGVLFWVAGFDLLYALQDLSFDQSQGLFSLPVRLGPRRTFQAAKIFHLLFLIALVIYGILVHSGWIYWLGLVISSFLLFWQHFILRNDLTRIQAAFFTSNGLLSLFFLVFLLCDRIIA